jgi:predicted enzyme related to lactoylglutathione lyase
MRKTVQSTNQPILKSKNEMIYQDVYSVFVTKDMRACKIFYKKWFNWRIAFESSFFILFVTPGEKSFRIGFLSEDHPSSPPTCPPMNSKSGAFLTIQVEDAAADFERLQKGGLKINYSLKDERWGQRRFGILDPNGMYIDIVQQIEPEKGFWEKYPAES